VEEWLEPKKPLSERLRRRGTRLPALSGSRGDRSPVAGSGGLFPISNAASRNAEPSVALATGKNLTDVSGSVAGEPKRSFLGLLPRSFRDRFREALDAQGDVDNIEWRGHALRILRPAEGRKFHLRDPERRDRLRLEPLSPDAYEAIGEAQGEHAASRDDIPVPAELLASGEVHRLVPFALARGAAVVRGVIDLLVVEADKATVIERLPGPSSVDQRSWMETRLEAVEALAPGRVVTGFFVVPGAPPVPVKRRGGDEGLQLPLFQS
jgi:hypothetical protein